MVNSRTKFRKFAGMLVLRMVLPIALLILTGASACNDKLSRQESDKLQVGAEQIDELIPQLEGKRVALVVNATSMIGKTHLVDSLKSIGVNIKRIFGPEHGFRGDAADGDEVKDSVDKKTGIPVISLYGKLYAPTPGQLFDVDVVIFDIQDVGARFYTYISTLHYVMEACAENNKQLIVLDRPNPNGNYVDGPMRQQELKSFVGTDPLPIVHGMTVGELARMINGEGWLKDAMRCSLSVVQMKHWNHLQEYPVPIRPSPNLPNDRAIRLYPSLCLLEGTVISVGRGTHMPFQIAGNPELKSMAFQFTPVPIKGMSTKPPLENQLCYGIDLRDVHVDRKLDLGYVLDFYKAYPDKENFFIGSFDRLAGTTELRKQIIAGLNEEQIRESWQADLAVFKAKRAKYLLYPEVKPIK